MFSRENVQRWLISSALTFAAGAGVVLLANWDSITLDSFKDGSVVGVVFLVVRAGLKALVEAFLALYVANR